MKKDCLLVLCFYEGQGFCPKEDRKIIVTAQIDGHVLSTDPVPLTSQPKLCTEVSWQIDSQTLRRYKLSRVPVRVECHSINTSKEEKHSLGYIILTLSSVVQGIETDPKWHKLLGGKLVQSKYSPQLLISMNLHPIGLNGKVQSDSSKMLPNGNVHGGPFSMGSVGNVVNNHVTQQNGTSRAMQDGNGNPHIPLSLQESLQRSDFGALSKLGALLSDCSQIQITSSQAFHTPEVGNNGKGDSEPRQLGEGDYFSPHEIDLDDDEENEENEDGASFCEIGEVYSENVEEENAVMPEMGSHRGQKSPQRKDVPQQSENAKINEFSFCNGKPRPEYNSKLIPASPVEQAKSLLSYCSMDGVKSHDTSKNYKENYSEIEDDVLDSGIQSRFSGHIQSGSRAQSSLHHLSEDVGSSFPGQGSGFQKSVDGRSHSDPLNPLSIHKSIPSGSVRGFKSGANVIPGRRSHGVEENLVPQLHHEGGYFQIGPAGELDEETFEFAVTIVFAKNLDQLLPKDFVRKASSEVCFSYSLLGCVITGDTIKDLHNPDFLAERAAGKIKATAANLSAYFRKNSELPVHLLTGDLCLASTSINLAKFHDVDSDLIMHTSVTIEGWYPLLSEVHDSKYVIPGKEPMLGVILELSGHIPPDNDYDLDLNEHSHHSKRRFRGDKYHSSKMEAAIESSSEEDIFPSGKRRKGPNLRLLRQREKSSSKRYDLNEVSCDDKLKKQLYQTALAVEEWKENQQTIFLKQWSAREAELQRHLADEWRGRVIQSHMRLDQTDALYESLRSALSELSLREKKLSHKEERVGKLLEELEQQKLELGSKEEGLEGSLKQRENENKNVSLLLDELKKEKEEKKLLENENEELKAAFSQTELPSQQQHRELKKQIIMLTREKDNLTENLSEALKKKKYYKVMWVRTVGELHQLKTSYKHEVELLRSEIEMSSPEPYYTHPQQYRRRRQRSHTIDGGLLEAELSSRSSKNGKKLDPLYSVKSPGQVIKESDQMQPGCSWMDLKGRRETKGQVEPRVGCVPRNRRESGRTVDMVKARTSIGNADEYEELNKEMRNDEAFESFLKEKKSCPWKPSHTQS